MRCWRRRPSPARVLFPPSTDLHTATGPTSRLGWDTLIAALDAPAPYKSARNLETSYFFGETDRICARGNGNRIFRTGRLIDIGSLLGRFNEQAWPISSAMAWPQGLSPDRVAAFAPGGTVAKAFRIRRRGISAGHSRARAKPGARRPCSRGSAPAQRPAADDDPFPGADQCDLFCGPSWARSQWRGTSITPC